MNREEITTRVTKLTIDHLGVDPAKVTEDARFVDDLGADSLDVVELVMAFEDEFKVGIADAESEDIVTVKDAIDLLVSKGV